MSLGTGERKDHSPIYCQIAEALRNKIFNSELAPLSRLPSEHVLCGLYEASRITIRSSLKKLETEGLIHRVNGKGTFVSKLKDKQRQVILVLDREPHEARHLHDLVMGALLRAQEDGFSVLISTCAQLRGFLEEALAKPFRQSGVVFLRCLEFRMADIAFAEKHGIPCLLEGTQRPKGCNWLAVDNEDAMRQIVDHLYGVGRRKFGIFNAELESPWSPFKERYDATLRRLAELGIPQKNISTVTLSANADMGSQPYALTSGFFKGGKSPDAVICVNDMIAVQVLKWIGDNRHKVSQKIAVTGFDDVDIAKYANPPLTTMRQNYYEVGGDAIRQLRSMMDDFDNRRVQIVRKLQLIIRKSTSTET